MIQGTTKSSHMNPMRTAAVPRLARFSPTNTQNNVCVMSPMTPNAGTIGSRPFILLFEPTRRSQSLNNNSIMTTLTVMSAAAIPSHTSILASHEPGWVKSYMNISSVAAGHAQPVAFILIQVLQIRRSVRVSVLERFSLKERESAACNLRHTRRDNISEHSLGL